MVKPDFGVLMCYLILLKFLKLYSMAQKDCEIENLQKEEPIQ